MFCKEASTSATPLIGLEIYSHGLMEEANLEIDVLIVDLMKHQKVGLHWLKSQEQEKNSIGGLLADDQVVGISKSLI
jgi:hypothetical protein